VNSLWRTILPIIKYAFKIQGDKTVVSQIAVQVFLRDNASFM